MSNIKVSRGYFYKILEYYQNLLYDRFLNQPLTWLNQQGILAALQIAVVQCKNRETHPAWHIPLTVRFDLPTNSFYVEPINPNEIEYI